MNRAIKHTLLILFLLMAVGLSGCATTAQLEEVRAEAKAASDRAASAQSAADAALAEAKAARAAAERAEQAANEAKAAAQATDAKIDQMFKKTMNK